MKNGILPISDRVKNFDWRGFDVELSHDNYGYIKVNVSMEVGNIILQDGFSIRDLRQLKLNIARIKLGFTERLQKLIAKRRWRKDYRTAIQLVVGRFWA